jgi:hypothetical protein
MLKVSPFQPFIRQWETKVSTGKMLYLASTAAKMEMSSGGQAMGRILLFARLVFRPEFTQVVSGANRSDQMRIEIQ